MHKHKHPFSRTATKPHQEPKDEESAQACDDHRVVPPFEALKIGLVSHRVLRFLDPVTMKVKETLVSVRLTSEDYEKVASHLRVMLIIIHIIIHCKSIIK